MEWFNSHSFSLIEPSKVCSEPTVKAIEKPIDSMEGFLILANDNAKTKTDTKVGV